MSLVTIQTMSFDGGTLSVQAAGGNPNPGYGYKVSCNRGTLTPVSGPIVAPGGLVGPKKWSWVDNWTGTGRGSTLYIEARAFDADGKSGFSSIFRAISYAPNTLTTAVAPRGVGPSSTVSTVSWAGGIATVTTTAAHSLTTGDAVTITGVSPGGYNVSKTACTVTDGTHFTYVLPTNPGVYVSGGSITSILDDGPGLQSDLNTAVTNAGGAHLVYRFPAGAVYTCSTFTTVAQAQRDVLIDMNGGGITYTKNNLTGAGTAGSGIVQFNRSAVSGSNGTGYGCVNGTITGPYVVNVDDYATPGDGSNIIHGVRVNGSAHVFVDNMVFVNIVGENVNCCSYNNLNVAPFPEFVTVTNCSNTTRADRQGYSVIATVANTTSGVWFVNCMSSPIRFTTFDLESDVVGETIAAVRVINCQDGNKAAGVFVSIGGPGPYRDIVVATGRRVAGSGGLCAVNTSGNGAKNGLYVYDMVTPNAWAGPGGSAVNWQKVTGGFLQSCSQPGSAGRAVLLATGCSQIRIEDNAFTGATGIYTDDGTGRDISQADNTT